ncbi:uncharacterized protein LOC105420494 [Amborella trichopoda]|uniref:uncharacterized protein LOC105420494 n=1 Tax=Amborella trichopoda TaxID=13333 RepID=UPI0005D321D5|nr:uncharacterized protein LOC105420494 [Amborella trichopoda]|eukprot:XP_011622616.1 uncharacterized protein LOC105420494 [Amborella trichopoda]
MCSTAVPVPTVRDTAMTVAGLEEATHVTVVSVAAKEEAVVCITVVEMTRTCANNSSLSNGNTKAFGESFKTLGAMTQMMKDYMSVPVASAPNQHDNGLIERFRRLKVRLGTFMLEGDAEHWWSSVRQSWEEIGIVATWESFLVAFNEKYFPDSIRERKEVELIELRCGRLSVVQYAAKFAELSCYAPLIINTKACKASKFEWGLRLDIQGRKMSVNLKTFSPLVDLALKIGRDCEEFQLRREGRVRSAPSGGFGSKTWPPPRKDFRGRPTQGNVKIQMTFLGDVSDNWRPTCSYCGLNNHSSTERYKKLEKCYRCDKLTT